MSSHLGCAKRSTACRFVSDVGRAVALQHDDAPLRRRAHVRKSAKVSPSWQPER
jgi:hypothetical protein